MSKAPGVVWVNRSVVVSPYHIGLCLSEDVYRRELVRLKVPGAKSAEWLSGDADACVNTLQNQATGNQCFIVCLDAKGHSRDDVIGLLVHESVHVWQSLVDGIGEEYPSSEFEAYSIQRIAVNLIGAYDAARKKKAVKKAKKA